MSRHAATIARPATVDDLFGIPDDERRHELIDAAILEKGAASAEHGAAQRKLSATVDPFDRRPDGRSPGGWWLATEVEIVLDERNVVRPDVVGWRRDRVPERPRGARITTRPDWICEILSTNRAHDLVRKKRVYHRHEVPHYWILDPDDATLTVHRHAKDGYIDVLSAERGDRVRAEPFEEIEIDVGVLFGDDEAEPVGG